MLEKEAEFDRLADEMLEREGFMVNEEGEVVKKP